MRKLFASLALLLALSGPAYATNGDPVIVWNGATQVGTWPVQTPPTVAYPSSKALSIGSPAQCADTTKPCVITVNFNSTAALSLAGGTTITGEVRMGNSSTGLCAGSSGTPIGAYKNSLTGTLVVGLAVNTESYNNITAIVPAGGWICPRQTAGTVAIVSAYEQGLG